MPERFDWDKTGKKEDGEKNPLVEE